MRRDLLDLKWAARSRSRPRSRPALERLEDRITPADLPAGFSQTLTVTGLNGPSAMHLAPDGRIFVAEQTGALRVIQDGVLQAAPVLSVTTDPSGERGLLGVTTDPDFASNHFIYVYYTVPGSGATPAHNRVSRFTLDGNTAVPGSEFVVFELDPLTAATNHNGGAIHFGPDNKLYVAVGDNNNGANSQSLDTTHGKLLRINADGSIPADNPFFNQTTGNNRAIFCLGLRNPFNFAFDPATGRLFINDVGAQSFEEINNGVAGGNYGWPAAEGFGGAPTFIDPLLAYPHGSGDDKGRAIVGAAFYSPAAPAAGRFPDAFAGDYFFADFGNNWVRHYDPVTGASNLFGINFGPLPVDLAVGPDGSLYVLSRGGFTPGAGTLVRIQFTNDLTADQQYVQSLYNDFLGRVGSPTEINGWVSALPSIGPQGVAQGISGSPEALGHLVDQVYAEILGRPSDPSGRAGWVSFLQGGARLEDLLIQFLISPEFQARADATVGGPDPLSNYINMLYLVLLNRQAATSEVNSLLAAVQAGATRTQVAAGFLQSTEYRSGMVRAYYGDPAQPSQPYQLYAPNLLRRTTPPADSEVAGWVNSGLDLFAIQLGIAGSFENSTSRKV